MKYIARIMILCCSLLTMMVSCSKKEALSKKYYYGNVKGEVKDLPGTPRMELYANGEKVANVVGGQFGLSPTIEVPAEESLILQFKREGTNEVLLDTTVTIPKYQSAYFNLAYSEELGIKGFLQSQAADPDSITFQVFNKLKEPYNYPDVDLYIVKGDLFTLVVEDTITIIPEFKKGQLMPQTIKVPNFPPDWGADGTYPAYLGMLKNRQTGEFIIHNVLGAPPFYLVIGADPNGRYGICIVENDGDLIMSNVVVL